MATKAQILQVLDHIMVELQELNQDITKLTTEFHAFQQQANERLNTIEVRLDNVEERSDIMDEVTVTKDGLEQVMAEHHKDIVALLTIISTKIGEQDERCDHKVAALNERLFTQEGHLKPVVFGSMAL